MPKKAAVKKVVPSSPPTKKVMKKVSPIQPAKVDIEGQSKHREVTYPAIQVSIKVGDDPITVEYAKQLLGWQEEPEGKKFGEEYVKEVKSLVGVKVRLHNNVNNRPIYISNVHDLCQEHLRKRWRINCENLIVGKTGLILNGQHCLLSLILAADLWNKDKDKYPEWTTEPTMEKLVAFGCEESDDVVNTLDTGKRRSLMDCIYRSDLFKNLEGKDRRTVAKICEFAVRQVWSRTGVGNAFSPGLRGTHAEFLDFIDRHPKLLECVKHIFEEEGEGEDSKKISRVISCGYAAGLLYLMGCSKTDPAAYHEADPPNENMLDWSEYDKATEFFVFLAGKDKKLSAISQALGKMVEDDDSSTQSKVAVIIKAWNLYSTGQLITVEALQLEYVTNDDERTLNEFPILGGIDLGNPKDIVEDEPPEPKEVATRKKVVDKERNEASLDSAKPTKKATKKVVKPKAGSDPKTGDHVYVIVEDGIWWSGTLEGWRSSSSGVMARITVDEGFAGAGQVEEASRESLSLTEPD